MKHVEKPLREVDHLHIRLYIAANVLIDHRWDAEEVCSTYWRFYVNSHHGASAVVAGGEVYPLIARRIHFIPAWVRWSCRNTQSIEHLYAHFDLVGLPGAVVRRCFPGPVTRTSAWNGTASRCVSFWEAVMAPAIWPRPAR